MRGAVGRKRTAGRLVANRQSYGVCPWCIQRPVAMRMLAETVITTDSEYMSVTCLSGTAPVTASETSTAANTRTSTPVRMSSAQRMPRQYAT